MDTTTSGSQTPDDQPHELDQRHTDGRQRSDLRSPQARRSTAGPGASPARPRLRLVSVVGTTVLALLVWTVLVFGTGAQLEVRQGDRLQRIGAVDVAVATLVVGLLGWALLALLEHRARRPRRVWTVLAAVVLVVSLAGPMAAPTSGGRAGLIALHLVVGASLVWLLRRSAAPDRAVARGR